MSGADPRDYLPWTGDREARKAWEEVFSREVLGAVVLGSAAGKLVENVIRLLIEGGQTAVSYIIAWAFALVVGVVIFVKWHAIAAAAAQKAEQAAEKVEEASGDDGDSG